jgi:hypothetical protein
MQPTTGTRDTRRVIAAASLGLLLVVVLGVYFRIDRVPPPSDSWWMSQLAGELHVALGGLDGLGGRALRRQLALHGLPGKACRIEHGACGIDVVAHRATTAGA